MAEVLRKWALHAEFDLEVEEWDITNGPEQDLLREENRQKILAAILQGTYVAVLMSPPCGTWSRAPWANQFGPRPLRSHSHPWGFPWLEGARQKKVASSNSMVGLCLQVLEIILENNLTTWFWWEHPEDLGSVRSYRRRPRSQWFAKLHPQVRPASIWQLPELRRFLELPGAFTRTFHQCFFKADSPKPTRVFTTLPHFVNLGFGSWPVFSATGLYQGPLPRHCTCGQSHQQLIDKDPQGEFRTSAAAAYPEAMDKFLAEAVWAVLPTHAASLLKRAEEEKQTMVEGKMEAGEKKQAFEGRAEDKKEGIINTDKEEKYSAEVIDLEEVINTDKEEKHTAEVVGRQDLKRNLKRKQEDVAETPGPKKCKTKEEDGRSLKQKMASLP